MTTDPITEPTDDQETRQEAAQEPQEPADAPEAREDGQEPTDEPEGTEESEDPGDSKDVRDAKRYRKRAQTAEADLEAARAQVVDLKAGIIAQHIEKRGLNKLGNPNVANSRRQGNLMKLLNVEGHTVETLVNNDGTVDENALDEACKEINAAYGTDYNVPYTLNPRARNTESRNPWRDVLNEARR